MTRSELSFLCYNPETVIFTFLRFHMRISPGAIL